MTETSMTEKSAATPESQEPAKGFFGESTPPAPSAEKSISFNDFLESIPEDKRGVLTKNGVKDTDTLLKSYEGLLSLKGRKGLKPGDDATPEEKEEYKKSIYAEIGVPENGEYTFNTPENVSAELISDDFVNGLAEVAHKSGVSQDGFQAIIDTIYPAYQEEVGLYQKEIESLKAKLGEGTMNPSDDAAPAAPVDPDAKMVELQRAMIDAHKKNDYTAYDAARKAINKLRGY